jgi:hypothetical protein
MKQITVPVPDSLMQRIEEQAKRRNTTAVELMSLWLWDAEYQRRDEDGRRGARGVNSQANRPLSTRDDDGLDGCYRVAAPEQSSG